jgi:very-short-patch-repair endonuclease
MSLPQFTSIVTGRIEDWKSRLIDLSRKNNLLYYRRTRRGSLAITRPDSDTVFERLVLKGGYWQFWLPPEEPKEASLTDELHSPLPAKPFLRANELQCEGQDRAEMQRTLTNLQRRSLSDYRERGVRILYVALGTLVWKDVETSEEVRSPLVLVPVELTRKSMREPFVISVPPVEDAVVLNPALQAKLSNDYRIELPPEDWETQSLADYYISVETAVEPLGWRVEQSALIGLFSFYKLVIYKDLEANAALVGQHPIVRRIAGDKSITMVQDSLPEEKDVDQIEIPEKTFQVLDADSSQRICIDYALQGQSFVMQGPPGTGKSQTVANIISECIARGRSVLFVSDKMAALDVVYNRLSENGLAPFCLQLHSQNANKKDVVADLKRCLDEHLVPRRLPSTSEFEEMTQLRKKLNDYVVSLHQNRPPLNRTAYEILGRLSVLENTPYVPVGLSDPRGLAPQGLQELEAMMLKLRNVWQAVEEQDFPWREYKASIYDVEIRSELSALLDKIITQIADLQLESGHFSALLGLEAPSTLDQTRWLIEAGDFLNESPGLEPNWVTAPELEQLVSEAGIHRTICDWCHTTRTSLLERCGDTIFNLPLTRSEELGKALSEISGLLATSPEESDLLTRQKQFLGFLQDTRDSVDDWSNRATQLADTLGLSAENLTLERIGQFVSMSLLQDSEEKPEAGWFDSDNLAQLQKVLPNARSAYQEFNSIKKRLEKNYDNRLYDLDLDELIVCYKGPYQSLLRFLRPSYRRDQKMIARISRDGRVPKSVLNDLIDARRLKALKTEIEAGAQRLSSLLGHLYQEYDTDFEKASKALDVAKTLVELSGTSPVPEASIRLFMFGSRPLLAIREAADKLRESVAKWDNAAIDMRSLVPLDSMPPSNLDVHVTSLASLRKWAEETSSRLTWLNELARGVIDACKEIPKDYRHLLDDIRNAESVRKKETEFDGERPSLREKFGSNFSDMETDWAKIISRLEWTKKVKELFGSRVIPQAYVDALSHPGPSVPSNISLVTHYDATLKNIDALEARYESPLTYKGNRLRIMSIDSVLDRIRTLRDRVDDLQVWVDFKNIREDFSQAGLSAFFSRLTATPPQASQLVDVLHRAVYQEWMRTVYDEDPNLGEFRRENHEQLISEFRKIDTELIRLSRNRVIQAADARKPQDIWVQAKDSEISVLAREAVKKRRQMPLRNLFKAIPNLLFRLKPCMLMSPLSVSQFLGPELMRFDIVVFDEASQIVPEDAIAAIYRGKTVVVAGDNRQLPPTPFFQKSLADETDWDETTEDIEVFDSILEECLGIDLPTKTLRWHYRSKHEGLIAFSNQRFYDGRLVTFPSVHSSSETLGVKWIHVPDGVYDRGGRRDNLREADVVADLVFEHFQKYPREKTLGVVTLSLAQKEAVEDAIELKLKERPEYERFFGEDRLQGFFVKNLETVQGDERDVIILSIGYGRDQQGRMTMTFGPLNKSGGERRLNVAITRAREKVILVSSIRSSDIDLEASKASGVLTLYHYLDYAERGPEALALSNPLGGEHESPLEEDVAGEIRRMGYDVVPQVGCSGYRIDLGVVDPADPGGFLLGVECDGVTYQSAYSVRDRDRLRQQVLERLGWKIHRIWSPAWVARRESEVRRLRDAIELSLETRQDPPTSESDDSAGREDPKPRRGRGRSQISEVEVRKVEFKSAQIGVPYTVCKLKAKYDPYVYVRTNRYPYRSRRKNEFHMPWNRGEQCRLLTGLVEKEGPIHIDYAVQRLSDAWGVRRAGPRVTDTSKQVVRLCSGSRLISVKGEFLWPVSNGDFAGAEQNVSVRVPVPGVPYSHRQIEHIPPEEIKNAMKLIVRYAMSLGLESLIVETARVFGFDRAGSQITSRLEEICKEMLTKDELSYGNDLITLPKGSQNTQSF